MNARAAALGGLLLALPMAAICRPWTVGPDGAGPFRIGMSLAQIDIAAGEHLEPPEPALAADATGQCFYVAARSWPALHLMILRGRLARIDVVEAGVPSDRRLHVGSSVDDVTRAYGHALVSAPNAYDADARDLTHTTRAGRRGIRFETQHGKVVAYDVGTAEALAFIEGCA